MDGGPAIGAAWMRPSGKPGPGLSEEGALAENWEDREA